MKKRIEYFMFYKMRGMVLFKQIGLIAKTEEKAIKEAHVLARQWNVFEYGVESREVVFKGGEQS